ncbi:MAG: nuclear transport factor 2 family protein [Anaerolineales bacterium]|nr:nuclear transport factor 2 family protein [Chloroflexota bacterium]MBL6981339.1 nuclear transport factor 2 family protein [Anaerolineales bacterium]
MTLQGKGFYIWKIKDCENGDANQIANIAKAAGLSHVLIKIADGIYTYNYDWNKRVDLVPPVANALRARGIKVWGWHYLYGDNPSKEASIAVQRIKGLNLDGYVLDVEHQYKEPGKATAAKTFMRDLRNGIGNNVPVALSSYRFPSLHPIPWNEFLEKCDYNMPQVYWMGAHNPGSQLARTLNEFASLKYKPPIIPTGAAFTEHGWTPTTQDVQEFLVTARSFNLSAANFWEWWNARDVLTPKHQIWNVIADYDWAGGGAQDITAKYIEALNSHDYNKVAEFYTENAVHVTAARTIVGKARIRGWYRSFFSSLLPNGIFTLTGFSGSGNSRHLTWSARSSTGNVNNGNDTFGLIDDKITYHYLHYTISKSH